MTQQAMGRKAIERALPAPDVATDTKFE